MVVCHQLGKLAHDILIDRFVCCFWYAVHFDGQECKVEVEVQLAGAWFEVSYHRQDKVLQLQEANILQVLVREILCIVQRSPIRIQ